MSNKVLQDPKQRRLFSFKDLKDLFTLTADIGSVRSAGAGVTATSQVTNGRGVIDGDEVLDDDDSTNRDNVDTLRKVMKSKGLAGIFDHHSIESDPSRKSATALEMEEQAKRVARDAMNALQQSVRSHNRFTPTWTGSEETIAGRFGSSKWGNGGSESNRAPGSTGGVLSSSSLLASLKAKNVETESGGSSEAPSEDTQKFADLLVRIKEFVRQQSPTTEEILEEFNACVPDSDVAIFRRLLKSVATVNEGRWFVI